jgi:hypothetical protein
MRHDQEANVADLPGTKQSPLRTTLAHELAT